MTEYEFYIGDIVSFLDPIGHKIYGEIIDIDRKTFDAFVKYNTPTQDSVSGEASEYLWISFENLSLEYSFI